MQTIQAEARLTFVTSNVRGDYAVLQVKDEASGNVVAKVELDAEALFALLANRSAVGEAKIQDAKGYATLGKKYVTERVPISQLPESFVKWSLGDPNAEMQRYAQRYADLNGFEGYRWDKHNYGWDFIVYRYEAVSA